MARTRKTSPTKGGVSFLEKDRYTAELTSGQLVFGISILLVFGLTCFLLGILVGRFEPAQMQQVAAAPNEEEAQVTPARTEPEPAERTQMARKSVSVESPAQSGVREDQPRRATVATPAPEAKEPESKEPESPREDDTMEVATATPAEGPKDLTGPRHVAFPDSAASANPSPAEPPAPTTPESPTADATVAENDPAVIIESPLDTPKPETPKEPAAETPTAEPVQVAASPTKPLEALEPTETPTPEPVPAPTAAGAGAFSIQVAAMSKESNAEALKKRFDAELSYGARIERVPARGLSIVLVGGFDSRSAAESALRDFKAKYPDFADAYIRAEQ